MRRNKIKNRKKKVEKDKMCMRCDRCKLTEGGKRRKKSQKGKKQKRDNDEDAIVWYCIV